MIALPGPEGRGHHPSRSAYPCCPRSGVPSRFPPRQSSPLQVAVELFGSPHVVKEHRLIHVEPTDLIGVGRQAMLDILYPQDRQPRLVGELLAEALDVGKLVARGVR